MTDFHFYQVGGCVRDRLMGVESSDIDFSVVASDRFTNGFEAFDALIAKLESQDFAIWGAKPEFLSLSARAPKSHPLRAITDGKIDYTISRRDGSYYDGRRPETVELGSLADDMARRDFTVNALAQCAESGQIIDLHGGVADINAKVLRFVGDGAKRIAEDGLRVARAIRFSYSKGLTMTDETRAIINSDLAVEMLAAVDEDRRRMELTKLFNSGTSNGLDALAELRREVREAYTAGIQLRLTQSKKKAQVQG